VLRGLCAASLLRWQCQADGGRAGTLEQALQRSLLHARRSRRPRLQPLLAIALDVAEALVYLHKYRNSMVPARPLCSKLRLVVDLLLLVRSWAQGKGMAVRQGRQSLPPSCAAGGKCTGCGQAGGQSHAHCRSACPACALCCPSLWQLNGKLRYVERACKVAHPRVPEWRRRRRCTATSRPATCCSPGGARAARAAGWAWGGYVPRRARCSCMPRSRVS